MKSWLSPAELPSRTASAVQRSVDSERFGRTLLGLCVSAAGFPLFLSFDKEAAAEGHFLRAQGRPRSTQSLSLPSRRTAARASLAAVSLEQRVSFFRQQLLVSAGTLACS